jgi:hypothetical protein
MNKIVLAEQEGLEAKRRELSEVKIRSDHDAIKARNERLDAIGRE